MAKRSQYRMKYIEEWETDENFKDWIQPDPSDDRKAKCKYCEVLLPAHHAGLCGHALDKKHLKKMSEYTTSLELDSLVNNLERGSDDCSFESQADELLMQDDSLTTTMTAQGHNSHQLNGWLLSVEDDVGRVKCSCCDIELDATIDCLEQHQKSKEHMKNAVESEHDQDAKTGIKYQKRWHMNPLFTGWLAPVDGDSTKAKCLYCEVELRAHFKDLERHTKTKKHTQRTNLWAAKETDANTAKAIDEFETKNADGSMSSVLSSESSQEGRNKKRKSKTENQGKTQVQPISQFSTSQSDSIDDATELLLLECETVDECSVSALLKPSLKQRSTTKKLMTSIAQNARDKGVTFSEETSILNLPLVIASGSVADQPSAAAAASGDASTAADSFAITGAVAITNVVVTADTAAKADSAIMTNSTLMTDSAAIAVIDAYDMQKPEGDFMELKPVVPSTSGGVEFLPSEAKLSKFTPENLRPAVKRKKRDENPHTEKRNRIKREQMNEVTDEDDLYVDSDFERPSHGRQMKRASHSNIDWSRYKKMYRREWELDPALSDWVAPVDGDRFKAACRLCGCILRAHYTDLRQHRKTTKHTRNAYWLHNEGREPVSIENNSASKPNEAADKSSKESKVSACYMLSKSPWSRYRKRYRKQWESDPQFRGWIASVPGDDTRARCKYCRILLRAHVADLKSHSRTTKHANNIAYGQQSDECLPVNNPVFPVSRTQVKPAVMNRKRKAGVKGLSSVDGVDLCNFGRLEDDLTVLDNTPNLVSFNFGAMPLQQTTLILPKNAHLDETMAAALAKTSPGAMFRVKKEPGVADPVPLKKRKEKTVQQLSQEELNENALLNLTRSVTLWEFLMMKVEKSHPNSTRPRLETILLEFKSLHEKVKSLGQEQLIPITIEDGMAISGQDDVLVIESEELAQCLGVPVGAYKIKDPTNPRMTRNIKLLSNASRKRSKQNPVMDSMASGLPQDHLIMSNAIQKLTEGGESEIQSLVIQKDHLQGLEIAGYDMDGQYVECSNFIPINGHTEDDGTFYALQIPEGMDPEAMKSMMQKLGMTLVQKTENEQD